MNRPDNAADLDHLAVFLGTDQLFQRNRKLPRRGILPSPSTLMDLGTTIGAYRTGTGHAFDFHQLPRFQHRHVRHFPLK